LLVDNRIISKGVSQCSIRIRKADSSNMLAFKFDLSLLPKILSSWFACGNSKFKEQNQSHTVLIRPMVIP
ncbi:hypothetical protein, partial [Pantoea sp. GbtcB22]|uniref:hypothetical protein n=1 Tax=Pantoea sp. GbtcB22 TaxID=2824767 RepID=UPI001C30940C